MEEDRRVRGEEDIQKRLSVLSHDYTINLLLGMIRKLVREGEALEGDG